MATAQIVESGSHQTAYLPEQSQLSESEVLVQWPDDTVIHTAPPKSTLADISKRHQQLYG